MTGEDAAVQIESTANPRIRSIAALRERKARTEAGATLVDGGRECLRALGSPVVVQVAVVCPDLVRNTDASDAVDVVRQRAIPVIEVSARAFAKVAFGDRADGIVLVVATPPADLDALTDAVAAEDALVVATEDVEKPGNLGAILRSADGAGADAVIAIGGTDLFNPNVIRASVGTIFHVPVATATAPAAREWLRDRGFRLLGARVDAATTYTRADLTGRVALVVGSEAGGLSEVWRGPGIEGISLPMHGIADSLNVSATAAILLYEAQRQRMEA